MRYRGSFLALTTLILVGCGGNNGGIPSSGGEASKTQVRNTAIFGLQLMAANGDIDLGLATRGAVGVGGWTEMTYDAKRGLWNRQITHETADEGGDGVSTTYRTTTDVEYYTDAAMTQSAGHAKLYNEQDEFAGKETTTVDETLTQGPLAGYVYKKNAVMDTGSSETDVLVDATHPTLGKVHMVSPRAGFTTTFVKSGKTDTYKVNSLDAPLEITLSDGMKLELYNGNGSATSAKGEPFAQITWEGQQGLITWTGGGTTAFEF